MRSAKARCRALARLEKRLDLRWTPAMSRDELHQRVSAAANGCRIFLSTSLDAEDRQKIESRLTTLPLPTASPLAEFELNYLHEGDPGGPDPANEDLRIFAGLTMLRSELRDPIAPEVSAQYDESFALFNRMRSRLGRHEILAPRFDGAGNPLDPI
jgi:hypothetical protein